MIRRTWVTWLALEGASSPAPIHKAMLRADPDIAAQRCGHGRNRHDDGSRQPGRFALVTRLHPDFATRNHSGYAKKLAR
jgi:hypothetical protein